jgi:hypothetical protein
MNKIKLYSLVLVQDGFIPRFLWTGYALSLEDATKQSKLWAVKIIPKRARKDVVDWEVLLYSTKVYNEPNIKIIKEPTKKEREKNNLIKDIIERKDVKYLNKSRKKLSVAEFNYVSDQLTNKKYEKNKSKKN